MAHDKEAAVLGLVILLLFVAVAYFSPRPIIQESESQCPASRDAERPPEAFEVALKTLPLPKMTEYRPEPDKSAKAGKISKPGAFPEIIAGYEAVGFDSYRSSMAKLGARFFIVTAPEPKIVGEIDPVILTVAVLFPQWLESHLQAKLTAIAQKLEVPLSEITYFQGKYGADAGSFVLAIGTVGVKGGNSLRGKWSISLERKDGN